MQLNFARTKLQTSYIRPAWRSLCIMSIRSALNCWYLCARACDSNNLLLRSNVRSWTKRPAFLDCKLGGRCNVNVADQGQMQMKTDLWPGAGCTGWNCCLSASFWHSCNTSIILASAVRRMAGGRLRRFADFR